MYPQSYPSNGDVITHSACDGRRKNERTERKDYHCTGCGTRLPEDKSEWGLVWDSQVHGFCAECLLEIRDYAGVKPKKKKSQPSVKT